MDTTPTPTSTLSLTATPTATPMPTAPPPPSPTLSPLDFNQDGHLDYQDFSALLSQMQSNLDIFRYNQMVNQFGR